MATSRTILLRWKHPDRLCVDESERNPVVWVDVKLLDLAWSSDSYYVGPKGTGAAIAGRYQRFGEWLAKTDKPIEMPTIGLRDDGEVNFTDGRHRFAWLRDHGLARMPVAVSQDAEKRIVARFGVDQCHCFIEF